VITIATYRTVMQDGRVYTCIIPNVL